MIKKCERNLSWHNSDCNCTHCETNLSKIHFLNSHLFTMLISYHIHYGCYKYYDMLGIVYKEKRKLAMWFGNNCLIIQSHTKDETEELQSLSKNSVLKEYPKKIKRHLTFSYRDGKKIGIPTIFTELQITIGYSEFMNILNETHHKWTKGDE